MPRPGALSPLLLLPLLLLAAACGPAVQVVTLHVPADPLPGVAYAMDDLEAGLLRMGKERLVLERTKEPAPGCTAGEVRIVVAGVVEREGAHPQSYRIVDEACAGGGRLLTLEGQAHLPAQWAVYDLLGKLGVRFFHPEQTYFPPHLAFPERDLSSDERPAFQRRVIGLHRTHPIELSPPLEEVAGVDMAALQRRWIDWNVATRQTHATGFDLEHVGLYAFERGFPREAGFRLLNSQQGGRPILDPDDPRPEEQQIHDALEIALAPLEGAPEVSTFNFQFNPSEFTEADAQETVDRLHVVSDYLSEHHPTVQQWTINHGTAQEPTYLGPRFFDLPELAPPALGVKVHTLMFYDLERPAPVYGNDDFRHLLEWSRREADVRRIVHFPEASWWLTFDLPVPLYLAPVTLEARQHDLDLLGGKLSSHPDDTTGIYGHRVFSSGQEWGYWLIDWCAAGMTWDLEHTYERCLADFTGALAEGEVLEGVLKQVEAAQMDDMRDPEILRFLVGSDDETEVALAAGIDFHPLPPAPAEVLSFSDERVGQLERHSLARLEEMASEYGHLARQVAAVLPLQSEEQAPFVREIHDGVAVFSLRAAHAAKVYRTALELRQALLAADLEAVGRAYEGVEATRAITAAARAHVRNRERDYRYPEALTIAGDEPGTAGAVPNQTVYPYRYLGRTHRMFFWTRPDEQLAALFGEGLDVVRPSRRVLLADTPLTITLLADEIEGVQVDYGDGEVARSLEPHRYAAEGMYDWVLDATTSEGAVHHEDEAAVVGRRFLFPKGSLRVEYPEGANLLDGLMPGLVLGAGDDGAPFFALGRVDDEGEVSAAGSLVRRPRSGLASGAQDLVMSIEAVGDVNVYEAELTLEAPAAATGADEVHLRMQGIMRTQEVIDLLVGVGGFEPQGARELVARVLDYTPESLPAEEVLVVNALGRESP